MADDLKWFTKNNDEVKGPFGDEALRGSVAAGRLGPKTQIRREDEPDFRLIGDHPVFNEPAQAPAANVAFSGGFDQRQHGAVIEGSMGLGFCAGFFGGCIGWILTEVLAKGYKTKQGARMGVAIQFGIGVLFQLLSRSH